MELMQPCSSQKSSPGNDACQIAMNRAALERLTFRYLEYSIYWATSERINKDSIALSLAELSSDSSASASPASLRPLHRPHLVETLASIHLFGFATSAEIVPDWSLKGHSSFFRRRRGGDERKPASLRQLMSQTSHKLLA